MSSNTLLSELYTPEFAPDWDRRQLHSLAKWVNGMAFKSIDFSPTGTPIVKIAEVKNGVSAQTKFTEATYDPKYFLQDGDMLFCWSGQPETSIDTYWWRGGDGWLNQHIFKVHPKESDVDTDFFFQLMRYLRPTFVSIARNKQTTGLGHVTKHDLEHLTVGLPTRDEQRAIAATLGALDDKIESNRRAIVCILNLANSLYARALEDGSYEATIGDIANFHNSRRVPLSSRDRETRRGSVPYYGATGVLDYVNEALFDDVLVLVGEDGSVVRDDGGPVLQYIWGPAWVNNHAHPLTGSTVTDEVLYLALNRADIRPFITGAVQSKVSMRNLKSLTVALPTDIRGINQMTKPLFELLKVRQENTLKLIALRDALLPELLSGRIQIPTTGGTDEHS